MEMTSVDLFISIVVYKPKLDQLKETLTSLTNTNLKIKICVFDNSPEPLLPENYFCKHPVIYKFNNRNVGFGKAHNLSISEFANDARYVLILNPDVYFDPLLLPQLMLRMELDSSIGLSIPKICHPQGHMQIINRRLPRPWDYLISFLSTKFKTDVFHSQQYLSYQMSDIQTDKPFISPTTSGCFMLMRSHAFRDVRGFDERFFLYVEDTDLSRRISAKYKTVVFSDLKAYHYWSRGAYRSLKLFVLFVSSLVRYFNKWGWIQDPERDRLNAQVDYYHPPQKTQHAPENSVWNQARI